MDAYEQIRRWRQNIPDKHNGAYRRTWEAAMLKKSMRKAVNAKCQDCMCWQQNEIKECPIITCPLWPYRPLKSPQKEQEMKALGIAQAVLRK